MVLLLLWSALTARVVRALRAADCELLMRHPQAVHPLTGPTSLYELDRRRTALEVAIEQQSETEDCLRIDSGNVICQHFS